MSNSILRLVLRDHALDPAAAEVHVVVTPAHLTPTTELRGRLMGPRCRYASTIEVAYHLRPPDPNTAAPPGVLAARALIPEPSLWDPASPFLYYGPVELWQDGSRVDSARVTHGLRTLHLSRAGLRVNARTVALRGRRLDVPPSEDEALAWHAAGYNLLLAPADAAEVWELADEFGFLVLGRPSRGQATPPRDRHASHLGWLLAPGESPEDLPAGSAVGVELEGPAPESLPGRVSFLACPPEHLPSARALGLPVLLLGAPTDPPGVLGHVG